MSFVDKLNETTVTFVRDLSKYWSDRPVGPGWEVVTQYGEIVAFDNYRDAQVFRLSSVKAA